MAASKDPRPCSIADALALVGEKYSLLVLREVCLGNGRFDQLVRNIGAPRDILATRLRRLVDAGILTKRPYSERPQRFEYRPTQAGLELEPVLWTLKEWATGICGRTAARRWRWSTTAATSSCRSSPAGPAARRRGTRS